MWRFLCFSPLFLLVLAGCEQPMPNPEILDQIQHDLAVQASQAKADYDQALADLESARKELADARPQTAERKRAMASIQKFERAATLADQKRRYLELRQKKRVAEDQKAYLKAFKEKKEWPDPAELRKYQAQRRLETASRNWDDRVPKPAEVLRSRPGAKKGEKSGGEEGKSEGEGGKSEGGGH